MILFSINHLPTYAAETLGMIFGCCDLYNTSCNTTTPTTLYCDPNYDHFVNTLYAALVIFAFVISGCLNPALFLFHCFQPTSVPTILFRILHLSDFITTTSLCPYLIWGLLTPNLVPHNVPASLFQRLYSALFAFILFMTVSVTTLMTATRVYAIKYPLSRMQRRYAVGYPMAGLMCLALLIVSINFYFNTTWDRFLFSTNRLKLVIFKEGTGQIDNWPEIAFGVILMSIAMAGCVCAIITGKEVHRSTIEMKSFRHKSREKSKQNRSYVTILMLAGGIQLAVVLVICQFIYSIVVLSNFPYHANYFFYANGLFCSLVLSVVNPIITGIRSSEFQTFLARKLCCRADPAANYRNLYQQLPVPMLGRRSTELNRTPTPNCRDDVFRQLPVPLLPRRGPTRSTVRRASSAGRTGVLRRTSNLRLTSRRGTIM